MIEVGGTIYLLQSSDNYSKRTRNPVPLGMGLCQFPLFPTL